MPVSVEDVVGVVTAVESVVLVVLFALVSYSFSYRFFPRQPATATATKNAEAASRT